MTDAVERATPRRVPERVLGDCFICVACTGDLDIFPLDRPVRWEPGVGAVLTGAGPLGLGYVLVVPEMHYGDIAAAIRLDTAFLDFVQRALVEYEELFGEFTFWEHGSASLSVRTSGCVEHAHLNVIPKIPLAAPPNARSVASWSDVGRLATSPYLLLGGSGESFRIGADSAVSQHYRRQWASFVGDADRWDYAVAGESELQWATAARYGAW